MRHINQVPYAARTRDQQRKRRQHFDAVRLKEQQNDLFIKDQAQEDLEQLDNIDIPVNALRF